MHTLARTSLLTTIQTHCHQIVSCMWGQTCHNSAVPVPQVSVGGCWHSWCCLSWQVAPAGSTCQGVCQLLWLHTGIAQVCKQAGQLHAVLVQLTALTLPGLHDSTKQVPAGANSRYNSMSGSVGRAWENLSRVSARVIATSFGRRVNAAARPRPPPLRAHGMKQRHQASNPSGIQCAQSPALLLPLTCTMLLRQPQSPTSAPPAAACGSGPSRASTYVSTASPTARGGSPRRCCCCWWPDPAAPAVPCSISTLAGLQPRRVSRTWPTAGCFKSPATAALAAASRDCLAAVALCSAAAAAARRRGQGACCAAKARGTRSASRCSTD